VWFLTVMILPIFLKNISLFLDILRPFPIKVDSMSFPEVDVGEEEGKKILTYKRGREGGYNC
jgi:hypothetical protein